MTRNLQIAEEVGMVDKLILFTYESWANLDSSVSGLTLEEATECHGGGSSIAWTVGHITHQVDAWVNMRFQGLPPHPFISKQNFRTGGNGEEEDWPMVQAAVMEVRKIARQLLDSEPDLDRVIPYDGSIPFLRSIGLPLRYALMRTIAHHYIHIGEITTIRSRLGHMIDAGPDWGRALA